MLAETKSKGDIAESRCLYELIKLGYNISIPYGDNCRYDLIVDINNVLLRIQVKFSSQINNESLFFTLKSSSNHTTNKHYSVYNGQIDGFLLYHSLTDKVYVVSIEEVDKQKSLTLRIQPTKNNQTKGIKIAKDYELNEENLNELARSKIISIASL